MLARLRVVFGDAASAIIAKHQDWVQISLVDPDGTDAADDGDALDLSGDEAEHWLQQAVQSRGLEDKLRDFKATEFDVDRWRRDIESDLEYLREIHAAILTARRQPDPKLAEFVPVILEKLQAGKRVLLFTQSRRTAEYLEREFKARLQGYEVARVDSSVEHARAAIIHAFCPGYNPKPTDKTRGIPERLDVLISTDVLSEGVNLQEAGAIVSYDIHWNPVRLIQRIGRVDRRLDPAITPHSHSFSILNVLPPHDIEKIINLVEAVEERTLKISRALGIDEAFFKASDPAGTLKEFNRLYEGDPTGADRAITQYTEHFTEPDARMKATLDLLPPGAFGVWGSAPRDGLFALFVMEATPAASATDHERFAQIIGRPVLALEGEGGAVLHDAGAILQLLAGTKVGERSAAPSDEGALTERLRKLKNSVRGAFTDIALPGTIKPRLICWMELRKER
ncbi:MAG TPA: C-terminal helicase domain-containing protein [Armatimonadota bacterium]|nr:C-terminal helicase domain-containing protein [Armatimonadota bacterium]